MTSPRSEDSDYSGPSNMPCPICHNPGTESLYLINGFEIVECPECKCNYVKNSPTEQELTAYYSRKEWFEGGELGGYISYDEQTEHGLVLIKDLIQSHGRNAGSILDVGCGYGSHLKIAAEMGWSCFGIEVSEHARNVAIERLGSDATIVADVEDLIPHAFNIVLMLDVLEHLADPYKLFYSLFARGAIRTGTQIIVTTPNVESCRAKADRAAWTYLHPPSHLTYFGPTSLGVLFRSLRFSSVEMKGLHKIAETPEDATDISSYDGVYLKASGSDFSGFMQERYVPSTWSEIAEYEHLPRYQLACQMADGKKVLDFGCGTGYGTAMLATRASKALGVDIDASALNWARLSHRRPNLEYQRNETFMSEYGDDLFDLITCYEMIEHVNEEDQVRTINALSRLLRPDGALLISTPNPDITSLYGANPYHLRERSRNEFLELLGGHFRHLQIVDQYALAGIFFSSNQETYSIQPLNGGDLKDAIPLAYIAICSHKPIENIGSCGYLDIKRDYISTRLRAQHRLVEAQLDAYQKLMTNKSLHSEIQATQASHASLEQSKHEIEIRSQSIISTLEQQLDARLQQISDQELRVTELERCLELERNTRWARLGQYLRRRGLTQSPIARVAWNIARRFPMNLNRRNNLLDSKGEDISPALLQHNDDAYFVRRSCQTSSSRPTILHAIANFCLGGSSRLVVDLIEALDEDYNQPIATRHIPRPPAYLNLTIHEYPNPSSFQAFEALLDKYNPCIVHVHYWGDCDQDWYDHVFRACEKSRIPVIQNINTPVAPYRSSSVVRNVYVSEYVRRSFGLNDNQSTVIYPGSDLRHFSAEDLSMPCEDCIGMVYRLEGDKLNSNSIDAFIKVALRRPSTKCLIVGDGSLKSTYEQLVSQSGVTSNFIFPGFVSYDELPRWYRQMSIFVAPVWKESFGQVSSFAMNMGLPVVGYSVGALPSIVGDEELLASLGDSDGLAEIIISLLDDRERRIKIGLRNHNKAQSEYSVEAMTRRYANLYFSVISSGSAS
ncbi:MAG: methyltransferase domain-containing protein [Synechococcus sp.]